MAALFVPSQGIMDRIVGHFHRLARPVYSGTLAVEFGYSIAQIQHIITLLVESGTIRCLTTEEKKAAHIDIRGDVYCLTTTAHPNKANW